MPPFLIALFGLLAPLLALGGSGSKNSASNMKIGRDTDDRPTPPVDDTPVVTSPPAEPVAPTTLTAKVDDTPVVNEPAAVPTPPVIPTAKVDVAPAVNEPTAEKVAPVTPTEKVDVTPVVNEPTTEATPSVIPTAPSGDTTGDTPTAPDVPEPQTLEPEAGQVSIEIEAGRVLNVDVGGDDVASVRVVEGPSVGNVTVNPDNTLAVVMSHPDARSFTGDLEFTYEVTHTDGSTEIITADTTVTESLQLEGWGVGDFYMLETDDDGELVIEHGDNHREIHVSGSDAALSREEIAEIEDMDVSQITGAWLAESDYGRSPHTALDDEAGQVVWDELTGLTADPGSHWLLFEKGYDYDVGRLIQEGATGESELHPLYIGSYGEGTLPVLNGSLRVYQKDSEDIVIRDVALGDTFQVLEGGNYILDGIDNNSEEIAFQNDGAVTIRDSNITDSHHEAPSLGGDTWDAWADRVQGLFINHAQGVLLEGNFFDLNGFELDYDYYGDAGSGQTPSMLNHNIYVNRDAGDVTLRDNIILRGSSFGAQIRPGGFVEDNIFAGNNIAVNTLGGTYATDSSSDVLTGNYSLYSGNVITQSGFHVAHEFTGATTWGLHNFGNGTALVDNIIAHLVEPGTTPDVPSEFTAPYGTAIVDDGDRGFTFNDTVIYNWVVANTTNNTEDANVDGLDPNILDQVTIQDFAAQLLSQSDASIGDLADFLRTQYTDGLPDLIDADVIARYFQDGFGITNIGDGARTDGATLRFVPNAIGDGTRWDNRLNWDSEDLPGVADGDSVDLGGNWVIYGGTTTLESLDMGDGGALSATHGYLEVTGTLEAGDGGAQLDIDNAGQIWINGYSDDDLLDIDVDGGRFANTGDMDGSFDITVTDNAQAILATDGASMTVAGGNSISLVGSNADVGFDGEGTGTASLEFATGGTLSFVADEDGFSTVSEFRSGHFDDDDSSVASAVNLTGGTLNIDVTALNGVAFQDTLIEVDEITGAFDDLEIIGLPDDQDAQITVDYDTDVLTLTLTAAGAGNGVTKIDVIDTQDPSSADLWSVLTDGQGMHSDAPADTFVDDNDEVLDVA